MPRFAHVWIVLTGARKRVAISSCDSPCQNLRYSTSRYVSSGKSDAGRSGKSGVFGTITTPLTKSSGPKPRWRCGGESVGMAAAQAEDRALLGSNSSADLGAKDRKGAGGVASRPAPFGAPGFGTKHQIPGVWGQSPRTEKQGDTVATEGSTLRPLGPRRADCGSSCLAV